MLFAFLSGGLHPVCHGCKLDVTSEDFKPDEEEGWRGFSNSSPPHARAQMMEPRDGGRTGDSENKILMGSSIILPKAIFHSKLPLSIKLIV